MSRKLNPSATSRFDFHKLLDYVLLYLGCNVDYIFHGATTSNDPGPPKIRGSTMTLKNTTLGRLFWKSDGFIAGIIPGNTQQSQDTDIHIPSGIRTHIPSRRAVAGPSLRRRGAGINSVGYGLVNHSIFKHEIQYYGR
jgi:hypothetical protein